MRNHSIDTLKFICAFFVIAIHTQQPESIEKFIDPLLRSAVPCFFMISGYFTYGRANLNKTLQKRLAYIFKTFCWGFSLYLCGSMATYGYTQIFKLKDLLAWDVLLFNASIFGVPLWYLLAYTYVIVIMLAVEKYKLYKYLFCIAPILLVAGLAVGKYSHIVLDCHTSSFMSRNFLFTGIPFFTLGMWMKCINTHISTNIAIAGCVISYLLGVAEVSFLKLGNGDLYASSTLLALSIFIIFINFKQPKDNIFSKIGREYSLYIYVLHWGVNDVICMLFEEKLNIYYPYISTLLVFAVTLFAVYALKKVKIIGKII